MIDIDELISKLEDYLVVVSDGFFSSDDRELIVEALVAYKDIYNNA